MLACILICWFLSASILQFQHAHYLSVIFLCRICTFSLSLFFWFIRCLATWSISVRLFSFIYFVENFALGNFLKFWYFSLFFFVNVFLRFSVCSLFFFLFLYVRYIMSLLFFFRTKFRFLHCSRNKRKFIFRHLIFARHTKISFAEQM